MLKPMQKTELEKLKLDLSVQAKNGLDFIIAATIIWFVIAYIWSLSFTPYNKSILTFVMGSFLLPLAWLFSKILKTNWKIENNPLDPLGLWLNFAQLFYFPILVFILLKYPDYFVMAYAIITGAHFFPYAWYYHTTAYAIMAGVISSGSMLIGMSIPANKMYFIPSFMGLSLIILAFLIVAAYKKNKKRLCLAEKTS